MKLQFRLDWSTARELAPALMIWLQPPFDWLGFYLVEPRHDDLDDLVEAAEEIVISAWKSSVSNVRTLR